VRDTNKGAYEASNIVKGFLKDERGITTLDFIFAMMITFGFTVVFFAVTMTLSMVEVTQYVAYSVSRTYTAANETPEAQRQLAKAKYKELVGSGILQKLYSSGWFTVPKADDGPILASFDGEYPSQSEKDAEIMTGARVEFKANILNLRVPFLGSTASSSETGRANINSYLAREVSTKECRDFNSQRLGAIQKVYQGPYKPKAFVITDNGC
jgi:hypothetical protein